MNRGFGRGWGGSMFGSQFKIKNSNLHCCLLLSACCTLSVVFCEEQKGPADPVPASYENVSLPPYTFAYKNPLYATLAGYLSVQAEKIPQEQTYKLAVDNFREPMVVRGVV